MLGVDVDAAREQDVRRGIVARVEGWARWRAAKLAAAKVQPADISWPDDWPSEWVPVDGDGSEDLVQLDEIPF
jgi:hypothetical protein